jgi:hypothetical protein
MSPTAAINAVAVTALTPRSVINRRISGESSALAGDIAVHQLDLSAEEVDLPQTRAGHGWLGLGQTPELLGEPP